MTDKLRKTALMILCHQQKFHLDSFRMVLSLHAAVDAQDAEGNTGESVASVLVQSPRSHITYHRVPCATDQRSTTRC